MGKAMLPALKMTSVAASDALGGFERCQQVEREAVWMVWLTELARSSSSPADTTATQGL
jgi:hypothetical protein